MGILRTKNALPAGIYSDMTLDGPEIGTLVVVIDRAKNLPNRKAIGKQNPYCAMRLAKYAKKTNTDRRGGQTPRWDQELRFTVHDSPDYYKLKCSVFNDDKRTDLIGEAWIDLVNTIKPGGGQQDFWQQLAFKGKYAGEIRIELTYYDTREQPAQPEKKQRRERQKSVQMDTESEPSLPGSIRGLGPREITRRPLPHSPAGTPPVQTPPAPLPTPPQQPVYDFPPHPQYHSLSRHNAAAYEDSWEDNQMASIQLPVPLRPRPSPQTENHEYDELDYVLEQQNGQFPGLPQEPHDQERMLPIHDSQYQWQDLQYQPEDHLPSQIYQHAGYSSQPNLPQSAWSSRTQSTHTHSDPSTPYTSSPASRPLPYAAQSESQIQHYPQHVRAGSLSPQKSAVFRDSPLRQSMTQHEDVHNFHTDRQAPPLPPKHFDTPPQSSHEDYPPNAFTPQSLRLQGKRTSMGERSPLQAIEDNYAGRQYPISQLNVPHRHSSYVPENPWQQQHFQSAAKPSGDHSSGQNVQHQSQPTQAPRNSYHMRMQPYAEQMTDEPELLSTDLYHEDASYDRYSTSMHPSTPPYLQTGVPRKAVGTAPEKLSHAPFGPDAYEILNPGTSPTTNKEQFHTPEMTKEAARQKEVEKLRDLGPIIGNDGRTIDPSDHLPSDTWAPEPESKQRKPEHVIHITSKSRPTGARASPVTINHRNAASATGHQSSSLQHSSPATRGAASVGMKVKPSRAQTEQTRPLPAQPYARNDTAGPTRPPMNHQPSSSFTVSTPSRPEDSRRLSYDNRRSSYDNRPTSRGIERPALDEYQVPPTNSYSPRGVSYNNITPSRQPTAEPEYSSPTSRIHPHSRQNSYNAANNHQQYTPSPSPHKQNSHDSYNQQASRVHNDYNSASIRQHEDPLAHELSMIDIGPSPTRYQQGQRGSLGSSPMRMAAGPGQNVTYGMNNDNIGQYSGSPGYSGHVQQQTPAYNNNAYGYGAGAMVRSRVRN